MGRLQVTQAQRDEGYAQARIDLLDHGAARLIVEPGDMTHYELLFVNLDVPRTDVNYHGKEYPATYHGVLVTVLSPSSTDRVSSLVCDRDPIAHDPMSSHDDDPRWYGVNAYDVAARTDCRSPGSTPIVAEAICAVLAADGWLVSLRERHAEVLGD